MTHLLLILATLIPSIALAEPCAHTKTTFACVKVVSVYDGDTITVTIPGVPPMMGERVSVRIRDIDTAEMTGRKKCEKAMAIRARNWLRARLEKAKRVDLHRIGRDKYFRILADVEADGQSIADELIKAKLAVRYDGGRKPDTKWCEKQRGNHGT